MGLQTRDGSCNENKKWLIIQTQIFGGKWLVAASAPKRLHVLGIFLSRSENTASIRIPDPPFENFDQIAATQHSCGRIFVLWRSSSTRWWCGRHRDSCCVICVAFCADTTLFIATATAPCTDAQHNKSGPAKVD